MYGICSEQNCSVELCALPLLRSIITNHETTTLSRLAADKIAINYCLIFEAALYRVCMCALKILESKALGTETGLESGGNFP